MERYSDPKKGKIIFQRCGNVLPRFLNFLRVYSEATITHADLWKKNLGPTAASFWLRSAYLTAKFIRQLGEVLHTNEKIFVAVLFSTKRSFFVCYFIQNVSIHVIKDATYLDTIRELFGEPQN